MPENFVAFCAALLALALIALALRKWGTSSHTSVAQGEAFLEEKGITDHRHHVQLCIKDAKHWSFYPHNDADPAILEEGLRSMVQLLSENPDLIKCAAGSCTDRTHSH